MCVCVCACVCVRVCVCVCVCVRSCVYTELTRMRDACGVQGVNPYSQGMQLAIALGGDVVEHPHGHTLPAERAEQIGAWVREHAGDAWEA